MVLRLALPLLFLVTCGIARSRGDDFALSLRYQSETSADSGRYHRLVRDESWKPGETAVIVCDAWDLHHSQNAVRRLEEFAPRLNEVVSEARRRGATIIHAPSECMEAYTDHPARQRAIETPKAARLPDDIQSWCSRIPSEEQAIYPIDQSDGGEDDDPEQKSAWAEHLKQLGRHPGHPWQRQSALITIDSQRDYISDRGDEVWSILEQRGIRNVILTGVHVNMCVLGRPFGLRQLARNGKNVVLMRDMTDTMYNPARWPYVSHFTGTDLIVDHIERFVCPTITSDQLIGGASFRFQQDKRPHLAIVMAEQEYQTDRTLPRFAADFLGKDFRVSLVFADDSDRNKIPGLAVLRDADLAIFSVRRRTPPPGQLQLVRELVAAGKPVIGIRTASHAFSLRKAGPPEGLADWPQFDAQVFGGHYTGHHGDKLISTVQVIEASASHPILRGVSPQPFSQSGTLYQTSPLASGTTPLLIGTADGVSDEPVAWTFDRADGGQSFYTSLGHPGDFQNAEFRRLLANAIYWAAGLEPPTDFDFQAATHDHNQCFQVGVAEAGVPASDATGQGSQVRWYRCAVRLPADWLAGHELLVKIPDCGDRVRAWFNQYALTAVEQASPLLSCSVAEQWIEPDDANWIVVCIEGSTSDGRLCGAPQLVCGGNRLSLQGRWQVRVGDDPGWSGMTLPARYGAATDILFEP